ncbi:hypothetical protein PoB_004622100 [Plakobranchus ocellatus]|uniref:Uncharacterized protein n=1 Tax=Plakobranchus ocellatus TaxID=259542 RepID=A0AAV4BH05_9GAST|nr:hypothetical protein PoB_004622100 [Plakobranchus ocellatus]
MRFTWRRRGEAAWQTTEYPSRTHVVPGVQLLLRMSEQQATMRQQTIINELYRFQSFQFNIVLTGQGSMELKSFPSQGRHQCPLAHSDQRIQKEKRDKDKN